MAVKIVRAELPHESALPCVLTINGGSSSIRFTVYEEVKHRGGRSGHAETARGTAPHYAL